MRNTVTLRRTNGHDYYFDGSKWIMIQCGCSAIAPICPMPRTIARGHLTHYTRTEIDICEFDERITESEQIELEYGERIA